MSRPKNRIFWSDAVRARCVAMFGEGVSINDISKAVGLHHATVRARLIMMGLVEPAAPPPKWVGEMRTAPGLPAGHLAPWPEHARFDSYKFKSYGVGKTIRPEPPHSNGVAEYGA